MITKIIGHKRLVIWIIAVSLILILPNINKWVGTISLNESQIQGLQLAITLAGIFLNAHYETQRLERQFQEERKKELRQQLLTNLDEVKGWLDEVSKIVEDITILRELSEKDKLDGKLIIDRERLKPTQEKLLRLKLRGFIFTFKVFDVGGKGTDIGFENLDIHYKELTEKTFLIYLGLDHLAEKLLTSDIIPDADRLLGIWINQAMRAIDTAQYKETS